MLRGPVPRHADLRKLAAAGGTISGSIPLAELGRVRSELATAAGEVDIDLRFGIDDEGYRVIEGSVTATIELVCQRCLEPVSVPVASELRLAMVWSEDERPSLPSRFEGVVVGTDATDVFELIEEELLLALPLVPRHENARCGAPRGGADAEEAEPVARPFEVLARLKNGSA